MKQREPSVLDEVRSRFNKIVEQEDLFDVDVSVLARPLTPEEAIGTPGRRDFPIITGRERVVEAVVAGSRGHAFTDSPREFTGSLGDVLGLDLETNGDRAIYIAALNAVLMHLGRIEASVHCRDEDPEKCAQVIAATIFEQYGPVDVGLIGLNPAIAEGLVEKFGADHVRITDLDEEKIGETRFGVKILDGRFRTGEMIDASDVFVVTGTTLVNGTFDSLYEIIRSSKMNFFLYGVTAAGISELLGLDRLCPYGMKG